MGGVNKLGNTCASIIQLAQKKESNTAQRGIYGGGCVKYGGNYYPSEISTDIFLNEGDEVIFLFNQSHNKAFIVGV